MNRRDLIQTGLAGVAAVALGPDRAVAAELTSELQPHYVILKNLAGKPILRYVFGKLPAGEKAPWVLGTCFTHPLYTPGGDVATDLAPADHPHHRGVFCAWVRVEGGDLKGDWWGWG